uniref:hypothetical protein n=1 Tax=uncultured Paracoccus sp. TaxID=189685 RepID=UPI003519EA85
MSNLQMLEAFGWTVQPRICGRHMGAPVAGMMVLEALTSVICLFLFVVRAPVWALPHNYDQDYRVWQAKKPDPEDRVFSCRENGQTLLVRSRFSARILSP